MNKKELIKELQTGLQKCREACINLKNDVMNLQSDMRRQDEHIDSLHNTIAYLVSVCDTRFTVVKTNERPIIIWPSCNQTYKYRVSILCEDKVYVQYFRCNKDSKIKINGDYIEVITKDGKIETIYKVEENSITLIPNELYKKAYPNRFKKTKKQEEKELEKTIGEIAEEVCE